MSKSSVPVTFLGRFDADTVSVPPQFAIGAPQGSRMLATAASGTFDGPKLKASLVGAGGDWVTLRSDGSFRLDVRVTLLTDDGAVILVTYNGVGVTVEGVPVLKTAPTFETGDERYQWLNHIQAVAFGTADETGVHYEMYALD